MKIDKKNFDYSRYAEAVENVLKRIPVKNGEVSIDAIHVETSLPYDLIEELIDEGMVELPKRVNRIIKNN